MHRICFQRKGGCVLDWFCHVRDIILCNNNNLRTNVCFETDTLTKPNLPPQTSINKTDTATQAGCWRQGEEKEFRHSDSSHWPSTAHQLVWKGSWELGQTKQTQQIVWRRNWSQVWQHQKYSVYCEPMVWGGAVIRDYWPHRWSPQYRCPPVAHFSICPPLYHHHLHLLILSKDQSLGPRWRTHLPGGRAPGLIYPGTSSEVYSFLCKILLLFWLHTFDLWRQRTGCGWFSSCVVMRRL